MGLFRLLLYIILFYLIYYFIRNLVIGFKHFINPGSTNYNNTKQKKEGEISIDYIPEKENKKPNNNDGEYVDYEEIK